MVCPPFEDLNCDELTDGTTCGFTRNGSRITFDTPCLACSNKSTVRIRPGACE